MILTPILNNWGFEMTTEQAKQKFFENYEKLPKCINHGCVRSVVVRNWKNWSFKSECNSCMKDRKNNTITKGIIIHKKKYCENYNGHLGFSCPVPSKEHFDGFESGLDLDHIDSDHMNNVPSNVRTYCKLCHGRKSILHGDTDNTKSSGRKIG